MSDVERFLGKLGMTPSGKIPCTLGMTPVSGTVLNKNLIYCPYYQTEMTLRTMNERDIREFAGRDWGQQAGLDRAFWKSEYQKKGFAATMKASWTLWQHMKCVRPGWPEETERQRDLEHHISFKQQLDQIDHALSSR